MKIKKNGKVINLTEGDIKKLNKSILKESTTITMEELNNRISALEKEVSNILNKIQ